ncbi:MAG: hypothetical protein WA816_01575 [Bacteroidales bacterium]
MRNTIILSVFVILISSISFSKEPDSPEKNNKFNTKYRRHIWDNGYVALSIGYSNIDKQKAFIYGAKTEVLVGHSIGLGIGGTGFVDFSHYDNTLQKHVLLKGGYVGLYIEPILFPKLPVYLSFPLLLGAGGIVTQTWDMPTYKYIIDEVFLIAEPAAELNLNITEHIRIAVGASYKFTSLYNVATSGTSPLSPDALENWNIIMTFKFGWF